MSETITGFHAIEEQLTARAKDSAFAAQALIQVSGSPGPRIRKILDLARSAGIRIASVDQRALDRLAGGTDHRGIVLVCPPAQRREVQDFNEVLDSLVNKLAEAPSHGSTGAGWRWPLVWVLDSVTDPHNLGAIVRSADKFEVDMVVVPQRRSAQENETVRKSAAGATAWVPVCVVGNLSRAIEQLRDAGFWVCGADMDGTPAHRFDAVRPVAMVMGSEGKGLGQLVSRLCDEIVSVSCGGHVDSLNVSVASAILMYEFRRQQGFPWTAAN